MAKLYFATNHNLFKKDLILYKCLQISYQIAKSTL